MNTNTSGWAIIIGGSLIIATVILGASYLVGKQSPDILSMTGSATMTIESDQAKVTASVRERVTEKDLPLGYTSIAEDMKRVTDFLAANGFSPEEYTVDPVSLSEVWKDPNYGSSIREYDLYQNIRIISDRVDAVTDIATKLAVLGEEGIVIQVFTTEYYYSGLPEARVTLLGEAMTDARRRAESMVASMDARIVGLQSASSGVVQVRQPNSVDVADYGMYDTMTKEKEIMVTVRAEFLLK